MKLSPKLKHARGFVEIIVLFVFLSIFFSMLKQCG